MTYRASPNTYVFKSSNSGLTLRVASRGLKGAKEYVKEMNENTRRLVMVGLIKPTQRIKYIPSSGKLVRR